MKPTAPQFVMDEVKLLFKDLSDPESPLQYSVPARANTSSLQSTINSPEVTWTWSTQADRLAQAVSNLDIGKYGYETDVNSLFQLIAVSPSIWNPVQTGANFTWPWKNQAARLAQQVLPSDVGKVGLQQDTNELYKLTNADPAVWQPIPNPNNTSAPFEISTGAADADSFHDFYRLQIAFDDVWVELLDQTIAGWAEVMYAAWDANMNMANYDDTGNKQRTERPPKFEKGGQPPSISGAKELKEFIDNLKIALGIDDSSAPTSVSMNLLRNALIQTVQGCQMLLDQLYVAGTQTIHSAWGSGWMNSVPSSPEGQNTNQKNTDASDLGKFSVPRGQIFSSILTLLGTPSSGAEITSLSDLPALLTKLDKALKEPLGFDVFAPASINFGVLLNYRQHWVPQSYQVGNLVSTIPLAPQEVRRFTTKHVVKRSRSTKELSDAVKNSKDERTDTARVDSEIVEKAKDQTNFQRNASGSFGNDAMFKVSASMQQGEDQATESAQTRREFHEAVVKSAQEYRNEHRMEIETQESTEDETTTYQEIRNPNDELTVTYLFYELQRRYLISEELHKVTPVIMVANDVPTPNEIDTAWILRHDWILKRAILDDSFIPAIDYLASNYAGEEVTLQVLEEAVLQQKKIADDISQQVSVANSALNASIVALTSSENREVADLRQQEQIAMVRSVFDPLGISQTGKSDGSSDRARVDFAKDAMNRAQNKVDQLTTDLRAETTALQVAIDKYTAAATRHFSMLADIDRLRIHIKDYIIYYMQAIWTYEPADQRYFRIYNYEVPHFDSQNAVNIVPSPEPLSGADKSTTSFGVTFPLQGAFRGGLHTPGAWPTKRLHEVADLDSLLGFKGNYMIFPLVSFDYMTWVLLQNYLHVDPTNGITVSDPDPSANLTLQQLQDAMQAIHDNDPATFEANEEAFKEIMARLLSEENPELVVVPSTSLYIEALPGTHPILEDFKAAHRITDLRRAFADARHAELENLRLAARVSDGILGDPDIDKVVVVGGGKNVTVDAGQ